MFRGQAWAPLSSQQGSGPGTSAGGSRGCPLAGVGGVCRGLVVWVQQGLCPVFLVPGGRGQLAVGSVVAGLWALPGGLGAWPAAGLAAHTTRFPPTFPWLYVGFHPIPSLLFPSITKQKAFRIPSCHSFVIFQLVHITSPRAATSNLHPSTRGSACLPSDCLLTGCLKVVQKRPENVPSNNLLAEFRKVPVSARACDSELASTTMLTQ